MSTHSLPSIDTADSSDPCRLFRLPPELRNQIYEYVLYAPQGLSCRVLDNGATKFYERTLVRAHRRFVDWLRRRSPNPSPNLAIETTTIRPHKVFMDRVRRRPAHFTSARLENNQLKYVCRRLCRETRGMDLRCNCIFITDACSLSAVKQSVLLFRRCSLPRRVTIVSSAEFFAAEYGERNFAAVVAHCVADPAVVVRLHIPYWSQASPSFLPLGLYLLSALRGDTRPVAQLARSTFVTYLVDSVPELLEAAFHNPPNLRFVPREENFDRDVFQRGLGQSSLWTLSCSQVVLEEMTKLAEQWFRDGL
jgi:hypothetical protein